MPPLPRVFIDPSHEAALLDDVPQGGVLLALSPEDHHHLSVVLRLEDGAAVVAVSNLSRREFDAQLEGSSLRLLRLRAAASFVPRVNVLACALLKHDLCNLVAEKACELGIEALVLYQAERSVVRLRDSAQGIRRLERTTKILEAAAKQSKKSFVPKLHLAHDTDQLIALLRELAQPQERHLLCSLHPEATPMRSLLPPPSSVSLLVGPEGDFTQREEQRFVTELGAERVTLGTPVLRAETAAIAALAVAYGLWDARA